MRAPLLTLVAALAAGPAQAQTPPAKPPSPPSAPAAPAAAQAAAEDEERSLFETTARQLHLGGRFSSISGDPARFQRYEDLRDGLLFTAFRYAGEKNAQLFQVAADNLGWRDQRFSGRFERPGRFKITGLWDEIPQFYSVDTKTPYTTNGGVLTLDDATQRSIQLGQANLNAYVPIAPQFDLKERRDIGLVGFSATATPQLDLFGSFKTQSHVGELPFGASFGFSNDVEIPVPYSSRANDFSVGAEWNDGRRMLRVAYDGSWFDNHNETVEWDSPLRLDDSTSAPGRGRLSLWPSNQAQTVSVAGLTKLPRRTQLTGAMSFGSWSNDTVMAPFTINSALAPMPLPRTTAGAEAQIFSLNLGVVSRPVNDWRVSARLRTYDFANNSPHGDIPQFINYDTSVKVSSTGGPEPYAHNRTTFTADGTWSGLAPFALTAGYTRNQNGYDFRIFDSSGEDVLFLRADAVGLAWGSARVEAEFASRSGSGLNEQLLVQIGEQPALRHYDIADRSRKRLSATADFVPSESYVITATAGFGNDDFDDSYFGVQKTAFQTVGLGLDYQHTTGLGVGGTYTFERYTGFHVSRSASPDQTMNDPARDWSTDSSEHVNYFSVFVTPPRFGRGTEARLTYEYAHARASYVYGLAPNSPLTPPSQLPEAFNKLQDLRLDVRHRLNRRLAATFSYRYEPSDVYDFALDPSVINGIVQPSSLVLGYVYRPYTAHSFVAGLRYIW